MQRHMPSTGVWRFLLNSAELSAMQQFTDTFTVLASTWLITIFIVVQTVDAQDRNTSRFVIDSSSNALRQLQSLQAKVDQKSAKANAEELLRIRTIHKNKLVQVASNHWQRVGYSLDVMSAQLPTDTLNQYRTMVEPVAAIRLKQSRATSDRTALRKIANDFYHSSSAQSAILLLAETAWQRGDIDLARHYWTELVPLTTNANGRGKIPVRRLVQTQIPVTTIKERLVYCCLAIG